MAFADWRGTLTLALSRREGGSRRRGQTGTHRLETCTTGGRGPRVGNLCHGVVPWGHGGYWGGLRIDAFFGSVINFPA